MTDSHENLNRQQLSELVGTVEAAQVANGRRLVRDLDGNWWLVSELSCRTWNLTEVR